MSSYSIKVDSTRVGAAEICVGADEDGPWLGAYIDHDTHDGMYEYTLTPEQAIGLAAALFWAVNPNMSDWDDACSAEYERLYEGKSNL